MKYSRDRDEACYELCKLQARLFERSSKDGVPSSYFAKVFFNSEYVKQIDDLSYFDIYPSDDEIYNAIKTRVHMSRGTVLPDYVMNWIGYLYREWAYTYQVRGKQIFKRVPISYLSEVYLPYHSLDIQKAIEIIAADRNININESMDELVMRVLKTIK